MGGGTNGGRCEERSCTKSGTEWDDVCSDLYIPSFIFLRRTRWIMGVPPRPWRSRHRHGGPATNTGVRKLLPRTSGFYSNSYLKSNCIQNLDRILCLQTLNCRTSIQIWTQSIQHKLRRFHNMFIVTPDGEG